MTKSVPTLEKETIQIQEAQKVPNKIHIKKYNY